MKKIFCILCVFLGFSCNNKKQETIEPQTLKKILETEKIQLLDVRTPKEIAQGAIENAIFINYFDENFKDIAKEKLNKNEKVYLYCRSGKRGEKASKILNKLGYKTVNLSGGYLQWQKENFK